MSRAVLGAVLAGLLIAGCTLATPPAPPAATAPAAASETPPRLIPLPSLFANPGSNWAWQISPDGTRLGWITSHARRATIHVRELGGETRVINTHSSRNVRWFTWAADSRRVFYLEDQNGDENFHVYVASVDAPEARPTDLTPWPRSRSWVHRVLRDDPAHVVVSSNRREASVFDLYRIDLATGGATMIAENPGDVVDWMTDWEGRPRARLRHTGDDARVLEVWRDGAWAALQTLDLEEFDIRLLGMTADDRGLWLLSPRARDRRAIVRVDIDTGRETLAHEHPEVDVDWVVMSARDRTPLVAVSNAGYPSHAYFDDEVAALLAPLGRDHPTGVRVLSTDARQQRLTVEVYTERGSEFFLVAPGAAPVALGRSHTMEFVESLGVTQPVSFAARDGLRLHGYLTLPPAYRRPGPLVLLVHGGHWFRDYWFYDRIVQFLANRGYAVLQVNYRGSTGYGRRFREAAIGEYAGKMHDDLVDSVRWAVKEGIADPARVASYGGSYGGYATLVGMTFTPEMFACGVDFVGMSNLVTHLQAAPAYWKLTAMPLYAKYVGDAGRPEDRARLEAKSPLFKADRVQRPILIVHGANDVRVNLAESERMVEALQKAGKDVRYMVLPDEGHTWSFGNWRNAIRVYSEVEKFLGQCLGPTATVVR